MTDDYDWSQDPEEDEAQRRAAEKLNKWSDEQKNDEPPQ